MPWRPPDRKNLEVLSEKALRELRDNLAHRSLTAVRGLLRAHLSRLPPGLQAGSYSSRDSDPRPGLETIVEMALRKISQPKITVYQLPRSYSSLTLASQEYAIDARFLCCATTMHVARRGRV